MSAKEARRVYVMEQVLDGKLTIKLAAELLGLSERQVKRLKKGMKEKGVAALMHGNRGRTPKHTISEDIRDMVAALAQDLYKDASAQHISELLAVRSELPRSNREGPEHTPWVLSPMPAIDRRCPLLVTILTAVADLTTRFLLPDPQEASTDGSLSSLQGSPQLCTRQHWLWLFSQGNKQP